MAIWWGAGKSGWAGQFLNGWQMPGLLRSSGISTVWGNQEQIVHAGWSVSHYNQRNRRRFVLPSMARGLWRDRSSSRSSIIVCATNTISFRILNSWECVPRISKASICHELFEKIVGTALATAAAYHIEFEWAAQGFCRSVFLIDGALLSAVQVGKILIFIAYNYVQAEIYGAVSQWITLMWQFGVNCWNAHTSH